jgi:sugar lactone lactonase YvrE
MFLFVALLACGRDAHASLSVTFQGNVQTLNTGGSITLSSPSGIVVDHAGDIFIADTVSGSGRIMEVNAQGTASVLTISGLSPALGSLSGIAIDGAGNLYLADTTNTRVVKVTSSGAGSVIGTGSVTLTAPHGVAVDQSGDLFISDGTGGSSQIVEVTSTGSAAVRAITVSSGSASLSSPAGLAVDVSGKLYIADSANNRIVTVPAGSTTGVVLSIGELDVPLSNPSGVAVDRIGNVFIADTDHDRILEVDTAGNSDVLMNSDSLLGTTFSKPLGVAVDVFGGVYIADTGDSRALVVDPYFGVDDSSSSNKTAVGFGHISLGSSTPTSFILSFSVGDSIDSMGTMNAFTSGTQNLDFQIVSGANTTCSGAVSGSTCTIEVSFLPTAPGLRNGALVLYDPNSNPVLTIPLYGFGDAPVAALSPNTGTVIGTGNLTLSDPYQVALDGAGNLYVSDYSGMTVTRIAAAGGAATVVSLGTPGGIPLDNITGLAVDGAGNLFIGDHENERILVVTPSGVVSVLNITGLSPALGDPTALAFDAAGNLYIADFTNGRIIEVSSLLFSDSVWTGIGTVIPTGSYSFTGSTLTGLTIDPQGSIYAAARSDNNNSILKVTASGVVSALAIPNNITPALNNPQGVAADAMGNLYIADTNTNTSNSRIVKITTAGVASVLSLSGQASSLASSVFGITVDPFGNLYIPDWNNNRLVFVNVSGAPLPFSTPTTTGTTDAADGPQTATVTNLGDQPLAFSANPTYTGNFSSNGNDTNPCTSSTSLSTGMACDISVNFTPQSVGSLSAGITVTNNTLNVAGSTEQVSVSGISLNSDDSTATTVTTSPTSLVFGQTVAITATVADTASGDTSNSPAGSVTFTDTVNSAVTPLNNGAAVNLANKTASLTGVVLSGAGTHTITANYSGSEGQYVASSNAATVVVSKASVTVTGPATQPVFVNSGQTGSVTIAVTGLSATSTPPSGSINYTLLNASGTGVGAPGAAPLTGGNGSSTATVPISSSLAPGGYTLSITYSGDNNYAVPSSVITIPLQIGQFTPTITWTPASSSIPYGTALGSALLNASAASAGTSVPGAFTYRATIAGGTPAAVTSASVLSGGSYSLTATFTPADTTTYATVTAQKPLTVTQLSAAVTLTSSASSVVLSNPLVFTAIVSPTATTPTGTVSFLDGTTSLGQGVLSNGVATLSTSSLTAGNHTITAVYSGNANFNAATSGALTESVLDFNLTSVGGAGTSGSGSSASQSVVPGGTASYPLSILPTIGTVFPAPITLSVTGLPSGATATIAPSSWTQITSTTWSFPASSALSATTLSIQTPSTLARLEPGTKIHHSVPPVFLGFLLLPLAGMWRRRLGSVLGRTIATVLLLAAGASAMAGLSGCGAHSGFFNQPSQPYTITVTATSGSLSRATTVTLTIE